MKNRYTIIRKKTFLCAAFLSTNRDLKDCIQEEEKMMNVAIEDLPSYQLIVDKVMEKGVKKGMEKGMEKGEKKGAEENAKLMFLRLFKARFGAPDAELLARIEAASIDQVMAWSEALLSAESSDDLFD